MVVDRLSNGDWRMTTSSFEHISPPETKWQITEWRSPDQINWTYVGPVLTTRDMPTGWQGSVYSPTIREFAPGMWRMLFTADGRGSADARSAIWSAVSIDHVHWQIEAELLGLPGFNLYYSALADDRLFFVRREGTGDFVLATAIVVMP